jgi:hypothetical protein
VQLLRKSHWVLTILAGIPIVIWTLTGFAFTCFDFEAVRGGPDRLPAEELTEARVTVVDAVKSARAMAPAGARVVQVRTRALLGRAVHVVELAAPNEPIVIDGASGARIPFVPLDQAARVAQATFRGGAGVLDVSQLASESDAPDVPLPAYRVRLDDARRTEVFVSRATGEIVGWRNDAWRSFDRLWSLHVMGFVSRDSPAHWPLRIAAFFASLAAASGVGLLLSSLARRLIRPSRATHGAHVLHGEDEHGLS